MSENWHANTTTMLNTEVYEQWKRNWLNSKLEVLKKEAKSTKASTHQVNKVSQVFKDRGAKKIRRMRALKEFKHTGRDPIDITELRHRPSLDAEEQITRVEKKKDSPKKNKKKYVKAWYAGLDESEEDSEEEKDNPHVSFDDLNFRVGTRK